MADKVEINMFAAMHFLKQTFNNYAREDKEKGTLSKEEFKKLVKEHGIKTIKFEDSDQDGNSKVTFKEYMEHLLESSLPDECTKADKAALTHKTAIETLKKSFERYAQKDADKSTMSKHELHKLLQDSTSGFADILSPHYFKGMDQDRNSQITFQEFVDYLIELYVGYP